MKVNSDSRRRNAAFAVGLLLCLVLAASFLAACDGNQAATPGTEAHSDPEPTAGTEAHPDPDSGVYAEQHNPTWFVAPSLDEQIFDAVDSDSMVVVRASLLSTTASVETIPGATTAYRPIHELRFTVHEYLEGSGPDEIVVVVQGDSMFAVEATAQRRANYTAEQRNTSWDDQQAVLFVDLGQTWAESSGATTAEFLRSNPMESAWDYTVDNLSRAWLPALAAAEGASDQASDPEFITDGAEAPPPTIALADLKAKIASLKTELAEGADIEGFKDCVIGRILRERVYRAGPGGGPLARTKALASGLAAGTEVFKYDEPFAQDPQYNRRWLKGADAKLFEAETIDNDNDPFNGYNLGLSTVRLLPAGEYNVHYMPQHHKFIPCNFKPDNAYLDWTVTVTAPAETVHEAFFDPVAIGTGAGVDEANGTLSPTGFTIGDTALALESLTWDDGSVTLSLSPYAALSGGHLDFIALDGTTALSLAVDEATENGGAGTLSWAVATQPWVAGDQLMLRLRDTSLATAHSPTILALAVESGDDNDLEVSFTSNGSVHYYQFELYQKYSWGSIRRGLPMGSTGELVGYVRPNCELFAGRYHYSLTRFLSIILHTTP